MEEDRVTVTVVPGGGQVTVTAVYGSVDQNGFWVLGFGSRVSDVDLATDVLGSWVLRVRDMDVATDVLGFGSRVRGIDVATDVLGSVLGFWFTDP